MANYRAFPYRVQARGRHERGFTLIEAMCATLVLVIGMMAVYSAEAGAARVHGQSQQLFRATQIADNMLQVCSVLEANELSQLAAGKLTRTYDATGNVTEKNSAGSIFELSLTQGATSSTVNNVLVTVSWRSGSKRVPKQIVLTGMYPK